jgi:hypothetical protein
MVYVFHRRGEKLGHLDAYWFPKVIVWEGAANSSAFPMLLSGLGGVGSTEWEKASGAEPGNVLEDLRNVGRVLPLSARVHKCYLTKIRKVL